MAVTGNSINRAINLTTGAALVAGDARTINSVPLTQGQIFGGGASGVAQAINLVANGFTIDSSVAGTITFNAPPATTPGLAFVSSTAATAPLAANVALIANGTGARQVFSLPATAAVGSVWGVVGGSNATGWEIQAATGQTINQGDVSSSAGGTVSSGSEWDSVVVVCTTANTAFSVVQSQGDLSLA
jgi:hypothetical protein